MYIIAVIIKTIKIISKIVLRVDPKNLLYFFIYKYFNIKKNPYKKLMFIRGFF